ncbi:acyl-coenzyme A thioesterase 9, mitochondrial isoform X2 [Ciona intestinalis]
MEDLDLLAGYISYTHCDKSALHTGISPLSIVTAMVDEIKIHHDLIDPTVDIIMTGHVMWTGKSSLEIGMWLKQEDKSVLDAEFVMVARDPESKKAAVIHPLETTNEEEMKLFEAGNQHKQQRLAEANESLFQNPPTLEERQIVHEIFLKTLDPRSKSFRSRVLPEGSVWMESTRLKNAVVCFPEKRNIHNKVFGGYLMRKAFELAWANACVFSGNRPYVVAVDDILFHCPVPIGSLLLMSSQVSYSDGKKFIARVHAEVMDTLQGTSTTSNVFHFTFTCGDHPVPTVVPMTYGGRVWKGIWRWYDERMVRSCNLDEIQKEGVTMDQLACIARCNQLNADVVYVDEHTSIDDFRRVVEDTCKGNSSAVICSFGKSYLGALGVGQFATIAGYHAERGLVLALEPARYKHRIFWTPLECLWGAMVATDKATDPTIDLQRGYMVLSQAKPLKNRKNIE